jgi:hypothetical protein
VTEPSIRALAADFSTAPVKSCVVLVPCYQIGNNVAHTLVL